MRWTAERFPKLADPLRALAEQHREFKDEPLHLAIAFDPQRGGQDVFLFELLGHFGLDLISSERELFEGSFESSRSLPLDPDQSLHLILTHFEELRVALSEGWPSAIELRDAVGRGDFEILYEDALGHQAMELLRG